MKYFYNYILLTNRSSSFRCSINTSKHRSKQNNGNQHSCKKYFLENHFVNASFTLEYKLKNQQKYNIFRNALRSFYMISNHQLLEKMPLK